MLDPSNSYKAAAVEAGVLSESNAATKPQQLGVIGPNSVIQLREALIEIEGLELARALFNGAGYANLFDKLPAKMVDEHIPQQLFKQLYATLPPKQARRVALRAGELTADYIIANRIPRVIATGLKLLPPNVAGTTLLKAIGKNAWTFVGSGEFVYHEAPVRRITIVNNPLQMPECVWHLAVFQRLFSQLVCRESKVKYMRSCNQNTSSDHFVICYGSEFFGHDCEQVRKNKLRQLCCNCVNNKTETLH